MKNSIIVEIYRKTPIVSSFGCYLHGEKTDNFCNECGYELVRQNFDSDYDFLRKTVAFHFDGEGQYEYEIIIQKEIYSLFIMISEKKESYSPSNYIKSNNGVYVLFNTEPTKILNWFNSHLVLLAELKNYFKTIEIKTTPAFYVEYPDNDY